MSEEIFHVIQCSECNPPCTFQTHEGWAKPFRCAFTDDRVNYVEKDLTLE